MKRTLQILLPASVLLLLVSCRGGENKASTPADTYNKEESTGAEKIPDASPAAAPSAKIEDSTDLKPANNEILARIDQYLVSTPVFTADAKGISNATVTIKNTLSDITFQKAIVEIKMMSADGKLIRNDFYPIQNIEPGDLESIKIPATAKASTLVSHVVKVKSDALTNGEMVLVGTSLEPHQ